MSKGLEALKEIAVQSVEVFIKREPIRTNKINEMLETKQFKTIEKELKALEIIKSKEVNVSYFKLCLCLKDYNNRMLPRHFEQQFLLMPLNLYS